MINVRVTNFIKLLRCIRKEKERNRKNRTFPSSSIVNENQRWKKRMVYKKNVIRGKK